MEPHIVLSDLKGAGNFCHSGARIWFKNHNIPWNDLLTGKVTIRTIEAFNDPLANKVASYAKKRQGLA